MQDTTTKVRVECRVRFFFVETIIDSPCVTDDREIRQILLLARGRRVLDRFRGMVLVLDLNMIDSRYLSCYNPSALAHCGLGTCVHWDRV